MVRGTDDSVCIRLLRQYARLNPGFTFTARVQSRTSLTLANDAVWVLKEMSGQGEEMICGQGTGFFLLKVSASSRAHTSSRLD